MNAKHQWKYTSEESIEEISPVEITFEVPGEVTLTQMLYNFEYYLKAVGFIFDGKIDIVPEDICADTIDDTNYCCMGDTDENECCVEYKAEKLAEWNKGLDKLETEVRKNKWVHGICNPPSK